MKHTVESLKKTLLSMIEEIGAQPEKYAKNPGRDFTRRRSLTLPALMGLILTMDEKSVGKGCWDIFGTGSTPHRRPLSSSSEKSFCPAHFQTCSAASPTPWLSRRPSGVIGYWPQTALP